MRNFDLVELTRIFDILEIPPVLISVPSNLYGTTITDLQKLMRGTAKKNFRRLSMVHHPDKGGDANKMKDLIEAYGQARQIRLIVPAHSGVSITLGQGELTVHTGRPYWGWIKNAPSQQR